MPEPERGRGVKASSHEAKWQHPLYLQVDPTAHVTFNLHLSKKEREAKDSLTLPFQFSSEKYGWGLTAWVPE